MAKQSEDTAKIVHRMLRDTETILGQLEEIKLTVRFSLWKLSFNIRKNND